MPLQIYQRVSLLVVLLSEELGPEETPQSEETNCLSSAAMEILHRTRESTDLVIW